MTTSFPGPFGKKALGTRLAWRLSFATSNRQLCMFLACYLDVAEGAIQQGTTIRFCLLCNYSSSNATFETIHMSPYSGQRRPQSAQSERAWVRGWCPFPHLEGGSLDAAVPAVLSLHPVIAVRHQAVLWVLFVFAHFSRQSVSVGVGGKLFILEKGARGGGRGNVSATSDASSETPERIVGRRGSWGGRINDDGGGEGRGENGSEENSCFPSLPFLPAPSPFGAVVSPLSLVSRPPHDLTLALRGCFWRISRRIWIFWVVCRIFGSPNTCWPILSKTLAR